MDKKILFVQKRAGDLKLDFPNPRKVKEKKREDLARSLEELGDFGVVVIDDQDRVISGFQRAQIMIDKDPDQLVDCKMLVGYTEKEKKLINIKANQHAGEWDVDALVDFMADLSDLKLDDVVEDMKKGDGLEDVIQDMNLRRYEKYDYVVIMCRNQLDFNDLIRRIGYENKKQMLTASKKVKARAIWYEEFEKLWH